MRYLTITRTLVYYDGPQLFLGQDGRGTSYLAVGVPGADPRKLQFLAVAVADSRLDDYFSEVVDLRNVFRHPKGDRYFTFSLDETRGGRIQLIELASVDEAWLPSAGFFASQHTEPTDDVERTGVAVMDIPIDGRWDMHDLAQFPNKYADTYAFLFAVTREPPPRQSAANEPFAELFQRYPWRGGYSSVSFYNDLYRAIPRQQKLKIREIRYASPGFIRIEASAMLTAHIRDMVVCLNENWRATKDAYKELHDGLSERSFLGVSRYEMTPSASDKVFAQRACEKLSVEMRFLHLQRVYRLCDDDWISTAKILLSFYRRVDELAEFYDSGKVSVGSATLGDDSD